MTQTIMPNRLLVSLSLLFYNIIYSLFYSFSLYEREINWWGHHAVESKAIVISVVCLYDAIKGT